MGEATYYAKIRFETKEKAEAAIPGIKALFIEGDKAADWWQKNRGKSPEAFWPVFEKMFPLVTEYLKAETNIFGTDNNNGLAGMLDFPSEEETENIGLDDEGIVLFAAYVWHFADWEGMLNHIVSKFGAIRQSHISDEYANLFDCVVV